MKQSVRMWIYLFIVLILIFLSGFSFAQEAKVVSSFGPVNQNIGFDQIKAGRMKVKAERTNSHEANSFFPQSARIANSMHRWKIS